MMTGTADTIPTPAELEAETIRRRMSRQAVHLLVMGHHDLALDVVHAGFVEQADVLGLETDSW